MKRKMTICALLIACLTLAGLSTYAYFTDDATARNVITAGNLKIELQEMSIPVDGGDPVAFEDVVGVMPGEDVSKIVSVKNTGDKPAYVRVSVDKVLTLAEGVEGTPDQSLVTCDFNTTDWTEVEGYYYYKRPLAAGAETEPVFENVSFDPNMGNMYQNSKVVITVDAYATQVDNNGGNVFEAQGWPEV